MMTTLARFRAAAVVLTAMVLLLRLGARRSLNLDFEQSSVSPAVAGASTV